MKYIPTIGLEIHAELKTRSKMFCGSPNNPLETRPNVNICPVCMGHPGTLPVANKEAIRKVIQVGLALHCAISEKSKFDRKNYFYPDLPKGYQISQYDMPFCKEGYLEIQGKKIKITRVHLEEDTGKLIHPSGADLPAGRQGYSLVDFNRAGVPLMELVTEPDIETAKEASEFAKQLQLILKYLGVSDADMEKGQMRVEANVSVRPEGAAKLGTKVEVKNLNSFKAVEGAIAFETQRQQDVLESGEKVMQETRGWDENKGETFSQREKEEAHDYRYFPEPDLPPLTFAQDFIEEIRAELPELPQARATRLAKEYRLSQDAVGIFVQNKELGEFFEKTISELNSNMPQDKLFRQVKLASNYLLSDVMGLLGAMSVESKDFLITPENFAELIGLIDENAISSAIAKQVLKEMFASGKNPLQIVKDRGLAQVVDEKQIESVAKEIIKKNPKAVEDFKKGKENSVQFLVGQMMAETRGKVSPDLANQILRILLTKEVKVRDNKK